MEDIKLIELTKEEAKKYKSIGKAHGVGLGHCLYLAHKYCKNFRERCIGYMILKDSKYSSMLSGITGREYISAEFYEKD